ncbi:MAG: hypothetical protein LC754_09750 [Acidobacteria bacterium]|nr:hypothetical protein [Acidobacteriota bacterium]
MRRMWAIFALVLVAMCGAVSAQAQAAPVAAPAQSPDAGITANGVIGEVVAVDTSSKQMFVKTDAGAVVIVTLSDATKILRNPPGETKLDKAMPITLAEVSTGDRVFAMGKPSDDRKVLTGPRRIVVNSKAELAQKQEAERAEWKRRGIVGVVTAVNLETKDITLQTRGPQGAQTVAVKAGDNVRFRRYAPDSVKFGDAKPSSLADVKAGDQLRAKGEKSADGASFTPEEIVTGTFRTSIGTITAVDAAKNEITIAQMQGGPLTVVVSKDSQLKRIPEGAMAMMGGGGGAGPGGGGGGMAGGTPGGAPGGFRGPASKTQLVELLKSNRLEPDRMTQMIGRRGVDFQLKPEDEKELRGVGASDEVIAAVRANYRKPGAETAASAKPPQGGAPGAGGPGSGGMARAGGFDVQQMLEMLPAATLAELKPGGMIVVSSTVGADPARVTAIQLVSGIESFVAMMTRRMGGPGSGGVGGIGAAGGGGFGFGIGQP